jgi:hypothetical protein
MIQRLFRHREARRAVQGVFTDYYRDRLASGDESVSGPGSTRAVTARFVEPLIAGIRRLGIEVLLDAPCGDFNWASPVSDAVREYIGADVVEDLIRENLRRHAAAHRRFLVRDLIHDRLPRADAVLCRDCLVHLSFADARGALANFQRSGARYLITTTFTGDRENSDIPTGRWRPLNLERPPFNLPRPFVIVNEGYTEHAGAYADKSLAFWKLDDL